METKKISIMFVFIYSSIRGKIKVNPPPGLVP